MMPLYRTVNGRLEPTQNVFFDKLIAPIFEVDVLPAAMKLNTKNRNIYQQGYCKPPRPPHPRKWRGPRLRNTHRRPSRVPRRYRVSFTRA